MSEELEKILAAAEEEKEAPETGPSSLEDEEISEEISEEEFSEEEVEEESQELYRLKVNGEEVEVPFEDLVRSYEQKAGRDKAVNEALEDRRKAQEQFEQARQQAQQFEQHISAKRAEFESKFAEREALLGSIQEPDYDPEDPVGSMERQQQYKAVQKQLEQIRSERSALIEEQKQEQQRQLQAWQRAQEHELQRRVKIDPEKDLPRLGAWLNERGVNYGEQASSYPVLQAHWIVEAVHKASKYDEIVAKQTKKGASKKVHPVLHPGAAKKPSSAPTRKLEERRKALKSSGSVDDAAALLLSLSKGK